MTLNIEKALLHLAANDNSDQPVRTQRLIRIVNGRLTTACLFLNFSGKARCQRGILRTFPVHFYDTFSRDGHQKIYNSINLISISPIFQKVPFGLVLCLQTCTICPFVVKGTSGLYFIDASSWFELKAY